MKPLHKFVVPLFATLAGILFAAAHLPRAGASPQQTYDLVIQGGRVLDPESGLDAVRSIGISGGTIAALSASAAGGLSGRTTIDARGMMVAPGFIDLHAHGQDLENNRYQAMDGVTTALELEVGVGDIDAFYSGREGKALIHFGATIGHIPARMLLMGMPGAFPAVGDAAHRPLTPEELKRLEEMVDRGLQRGAIGLGFGINYTPGASRWEILQLFRVAARHRAPVHVHMRYMGELEPQSVLNALAEVITAAHVSGAPLHVVHINSSGLGAAPQALEVIAAARERGLDITTECYPWTAAMTDIKSALFDEGWREAMGIGYGDLQWAATGERLTAESFARYRQTGGMVIIYLMKPEIIDALVAHPITMIASDGVLRAGKGHPRGAGTFARVLGRYVREKKSLTWMDAVRKMSLMPAQRLEGRVPAMKNKGRIRVGADADLVVFDPERVVDRATYENPAQFSAGIRHVLVGGVAVVREGALVEGVAPGRAIRAPMAKESARNQANIR